MTLWRPSWGRTRAGRPPSLGSWGGGEAVPVPIALAAGLFSGGPYIINNIPVAGSADYFVVGWTGPSTDFDTALAALTSGTALMGESAIFTTATTDPFLFNPGIPVPIRYTFGGMILGVPEPTTFALAGLGAVVLMIFHRHS